MKALILFIGWCILLVLCWPVALLALILFPIVWLLSLPLRLIGISLDALFALVRALLFLPARVLGLRKHESHTPGAGAREDPAMNEEGLVAGWKYVVSANTYVLDRGSERVRDDHGIKRTAAFGVCR